VPLVANLNFTKDQTIANHVTATVGSGGSISLHPVATTHVVVDAVGYFAPDGSGGTDGFVPLTEPERMIDTRPAPLCTGSTCAKLPAFSTYDVPLADLPASVPPEATALVANVTSVNPSTSGFLTVWSEGDRPTASSLNMQAGGIVPNLVVTAMGTTSAFRIFTSSTVDVVVDVVGYYIAGAGSRYVALDPVRTMDTRFGNRRPSWLGSLQPGEIYRFPATRMFKVPSDASAALYNTTVTGPTRSGFLTVYPGTASVPSTANLNFVVGQTVPNALIARVSGAGCVLGYVGGATTDGCVAVRASGPGRVHVIMDLAGYFVGS
jgi:hypothetical protein